MVLLTLKWYLKKMSVLRKRTMVYINGPPRASFCSPTTKVKKIHYYRNVETRTITGDLQNLPDLDIAPTRSSTEVPES